jgi:hypothetical protein
MRAVPLVLALLACACDDDDPGVAPDFPADYAASYVQVRSCRASSDHDLNQVVVVADQVAAQAYVMRDRPFATGAIVIKEEREPTDSTCSGPIQQWTVMTQLPAGSSPQTLDWHWQRVDRNRKVVTDDEPRCYGCHTLCGVPPDGYAGTCEVP